jgi:hypothetical protein
LVSVAVEGKVSEPFGPTIGEWLGPDSPELVSNKQCRLRGLCEIVGLSTAAPELRYQLLHRTASAVLEARRFLADHAVMLVHSFNQHDLWYDDFERFVVALGGRPEKGRLIHIAGRDAPTLYLAWARGDAKYLEP